MKKFKVVIRTPGKLLVLNKTISRTPLTFIATEAEIKSLKLKFTLEGINDYTVTDYVEESPAPVRIITKREQNNDEVSEDKKLEQ
jgi:hypothetical protein